MTCKKCGTLPQISNNPGQALFNCAVEPLHTKLMAILREAGYTPLAENNEVIAITTNSFQELLTELSKRNDLAEVETEGVSLFFLETGQPDSLYNVM